MKSKWVKQYTRPHSLQTDLLGRFLWFFTNSYYRIRNLMIVPVTNNKADSYFIEGEWNRLMKSLAKEFYQDKRFLYKNLKKFQEYRRKFLTLAKKLGRAASHGISNKKLLPHYINYIEAYTWYPYFFFFPWALDQIIDPNFYRELKRQMPSQADEIYRIVSTPTRINAMDQQRLQLIRAKINGQFSSVINQHVKRYQWLSVYDINDKSRTKREFIRDVKDIIKPKDFFKKAKKAQKLRIILYRKALKRLTHFPELKRTAKLIHEYIWLRTERVDVWREILWIIQPFYRLVERRLGLPRGHAAHLTVGQVIEYLSEGIVPNKELLALQHQYGQMTYLRNGVARIIRGSKKVKRILKKELGNINFSTIKELKGLGANPGVVRGRVKIILRPEDALKMKKGDVLVANMTHPDYILAIKKAKAIVTEEGGITCHAAIVSRELNIPCVISTRIATQALKDGDRVEVDANKGIVRKI